MIGAALCGLLQFLAFSLPAGLPVCIFTLVSFIQILGDNRQRGIHILAGIVFLAVFLYGQFHFLARMESEGNSGAAFVLVLLLAIFILPFILFRVLVRPVSAETTMACLWIAEIVFSHMPVGNPLCSYALLLADYPALAQWIHWTRWEGGSLWIILLATSTNQLLSDRKNWSKVVLCFFLPAGLSLLQWFIPVSNGQSVRIAMIPFSESPDAETILDSLAKVRSTKADIVLLPEGAIRFSSAEENLHPLVTTLRREVHVGNLPDIIVGILAFDKGVYDNAVSVMTKAAETFRRRKQILVPFSEYLPLETILGKIEAIRSRMPYPQMRGTNDLEICDAGGVKICPLICYEAVFQDYLMKLAHSGADLFTVSSSNSMIDCNHMERLIVNAMRLNSIRTGRSIVRCSEHGWSVVTDFRGRLIWSSSKKSEEFVVEVPVICPK